MSKVRDNPNDHSVVLLVRFGDVSLLFMGDAPAAVEQAVVKRYADLLRSDVLKVGHHGSRTSSSSMLLTHVSGSGQSHPMTRASESGPNPSSKNPTQNPTAIISVAERNRFGHPNQNVLDRLKAAGFDVLTTAEEGALWFAIDGQRVRRVRW